MRIRLGLLIAFVLASLLSPIEPTAFAVSTYPSAPLNITQSAIPGGVRTTWSQPSDIATGITAYKVEYSTAGTAGTWTTASTVSASTYSFDITGLNQVATYLRVTASSSAGYGTPGYPWTKLYKTITKTRSSGNIVYESGFGTSNGDISYNNNSAFTRIRYLLQDTITASYNYADVDFYKWAQGGTVANTVSTNVTVAPTISNLQVPSTGNPFVVQANVSDLNVFSSIASTGNYANPIANGFGINGRVELWDSDYQTNNNGLSPSGNTSTYDYDDLPVAGTYGSFQVHNLASGKTIFAWNNHSVANPDIGFGDGAGLAGHPDWTFCGAGCPATSGFALTIFINIPVTPLVGSSTTSLSLLASGSKGVAISMTATSNLSGFYTFTSKGKRIAGCINKPTIGSGPYTATCTWRPTTQGQQQVTAFFRNPVAGYTGSQASAFTFITKRTTTR